jgi:hypothetical protein
MSFIQKPNTKTITDAGITAVSFVAGAKLGDGISAVMPESTAPFKKIGIGVVSILLAASVNAKTPATKAAQSALIGMGAKQLLDEVTDQLTTAVAKQGTPNKDDSSKLDTTVMQKFINAAVGHLGSPDYSSNYLSAPWEGGYDNLWERPLLAEANPVVNFNPDLLV